MAFRVGDMVTFGDIVTECHRPYLVGDTIR